MAGRYVEAGDGWDWVEYPPTAVEKLTSGADWASKDAAAKIQAFNNAGITPAELQSVGVSPADIAWMQSQGYTGAAPSVTTNIAGTNVNAPASIRTDLATNPEYLNALASSGETGRTAQEIQGTLAPILRDLGNGMQGSYSPITGELQNIYNGTDKGGYYDTQGQFIPYQTTSWGETLSNLPSGMFEGLSDVVESTAFQKIAPAVIGGLYSSGAFGNALGAAANPGYYDEITGEFISDSLGGLQGPLTNATSGTNLGALADYSYNAATDTWTVPGAASAATVTPAAASVPSSLLDTALKTAKIASLGAGALGLLSGAGQTSAGETGFPIIPVPSNWTPPVSTQAAFTPSAPINFGSSALLKGTQWENQLPQRGFSMTDVMNQLKANQPTGMNDIIGGLNGKQVSISDIISGIQGQYGQKAAS